MIIYQNVKSGFLEDVTNQQIAGLLESSIYSKMHRRTGKAEKESWKHSLLYMYLVLDKSRIPDDSNVAIEYNIPGTGKRIDFMVSGLDDNHRKNVVMVELKQWEDVQAVSGLDCLVRTYTGGKEQDVPHPSYQIWSYSELLKEYNETIRTDNIYLEPCAFLHNYEVKRQNDPLFEAQYKKIIEEAPVFTNGDVEKLGNFISRFVKYSDRGNILYEIENGKISPSKRLQDVITSMIQGNPEFQMIDDQKVVYEHALQYSLMFQKDHQKRVMIVKGGPGTGKTVVAVNLLSKLTSCGQVVQYTTHNSAPRSVYKQKLKKSRLPNPIDNMFTNPGNYVDVPRNSIGTILADEAHRLTEKSGIYNNLGENEIKEIINASYCSIFFIDEEQRVTIRDFGSISEIEKQAKKLGALIYYDELTSQFRCNGSDGYLAWIDNTLEIRETANYTLDGIDYDFRVFDSPQQMKDLIEERNLTNNRSRILAGYCWDWPTKQRNNPEYKDIVIGDFEMSWNLDTGIWAIDPDSINEAGCIHTCQGLEFDYVGVIIGPDLRYENGRVVTDFTKRAKTDQSIKGLKALYKKDPEEVSKKADEIIKNTYRTLMTRGMKGCYIYCTDKALSDHIKECIGKNR
jgi:DUF2075 family protein